MPRRKTVTRKWTATIEVEFTVEHDAADDAGDWEMDAEEMADEIAYRMLSRSDSAVVLKVKASND